MQGLIITLETTNDAFADDARFELSRILRDLADDILCGDLAESVMNDWPIRSLVRDSNGNTVGMLETLPRSGDAS